MQERPSAAIFYQHKRVEHGGDFRQDCSECHRKWAELVRESQDLAASGRHSR